MADKYRMYVREFLNLPKKGSSAFILAKVRRNWDYFDLIIGDCNRIVTLEFPTSTESDRENTFYKIDLLYETIKKFRSQVRLEINAAVRRGDYEE